jgi:hypothetical protein
LIDRDKSLREQPHAAPFVEEVLRKAQHGAAAGMTEALRSESANDLRWLRLNITGATLYPRAQQSTSSSQMR